MGGAELPARLRAGLLSVGPSTDPVEISPSWSDTRGRSGHRGARVVGRRPAVESPWCLVRLRFDRVPPAGLAARVDSGGGLERAPIVWVQEDLLGVPLPEPPEGGAEGLVVEVTWDPGVEPARLVAAAFVAADAREVRLGASPYLDPGDEAAGTRALPAGWGLLDPDEHGLGGVDGDPDADPRKSVGSLWPAARARVVAFGELLEASRSAPVDTRDVEDHRRMFQAMDALTREFEWDYGPENRSRDPFWQMALAAGLEPAPFEAVRGDVRYLRELLLERVRHRALARRRPERRFPAPGLERFVLDLRRSTDPARRGITSGRMQAALARSAELVLACFGLLRPGEEPGRRAYEIHPLADADPDDPAMRVSGALKDAIRRFSDGSLHVRGGENGSGNASPDSAAYFGFGELAFLVVTESSPHVLVHNGIRALLPVFVECAQIFASVYVPRATHRERSLVGLQRLYEMERGHPWRVHELETLHEQPRVSFGNSNRMDLASLTRQWDRVIQLVLFDELDPSAA